MTEKTQNTFLPSTDSQMNTYVHDYVAQKDYAALEKHVNTTNFLLPHIDADGYTPFYYAAISQDDIALAIFQDKVLNRWGKIDLSNAILTHDNHGLACLLKSGVTCDFVNDLGQTPLDLALLHHNPEAARLLRSYGATSNLSADEMKKLNELTVSEETVDPHFKIHVHVTKNGPMIELGAIKFNPWQQEVPNQSSDPWKMIVKGDSCFIYLTNPNKPQQPDALYELQRDGKLTLHFANQANCILSVHTNADFEIKSLATVKQLHVDARNFTTSKESKLVSGDLLHVTAKNAHFLGNAAAKYANLKVEGAFEHVAEMTVDDLDLQAANIKQTGKITVANDYAVEAASLFTNEGEWISGKAGKIKAHAVSLGTKSMTVSQNSEMKIYANSRIDNAGTIMGKVVDLEAKLQINHYHGALIKGLSCLLRAPQVNESGFIISGQKNTLSNIDWALNLAHAGVNVAQFTSYLSVPVAGQLRTYLLVAKTLYRGADLLYKVAQGKSDEIKPSEWVTFILDNVVPSFGSMVSQQEKAQLLVNILYHFYGAFYSEEQLVQRSLSFVEALTRATRFCTGNMPDLQWLEKAADLLKYTRYALKVTDISVEAFSAWQSTDQTAFDNTIVNLQTLAEGAFREMLYALPPSGLLASNLSINPRDVALFIMNKGQNSELFLQSILYGALHVAKKQGLLNGSASHADLQFCLQLFFKTKAWRNLYRAYQTKQMSTGAVINEAIQGLIIILSYKAQMHNPGKVSSEVIKEDEKEEPKLEDNKVEPATEEPILDEIKSEQIKQDGSVTPEQVEQNNKDALAAAHQKIPEYKKEILTLDVLAMLKSNAVNEVSHQSNKDTYKQTLEVLSELQRAFNGEYAASGQFTAFVGALHHEGVLESTGAISVSADYGITNNNAIRSGRSIGIYGGRFAGTFFHNLESGSVTAQEALYFACLDLVKNGGFISTEDKVKTMAVRIVENHEGGQIIAKEDVDLLAEILATNSGLISGKNVNLGGNEQRAVNAGTIIAIEQIRLMSQKLVELSSNGHFVSKSVILEGKEVVKDGSIQASVVQTLGAETAIPEHVTWHKGEQDAIGALILAAQQPLEYDRDAFNQVNLVDVTLNETPAVEAPLFGIDKAFDGTLQVHLKTDVTKLNLSQLPELSSDATVIVDAPAAKLNLDSSAENPYGCTLRFIGEEADYSNHQAEFSRPLLLDVKQIVGTGAQSALVLREGGFLQADELKNQGGIRSDDNIKWNVKSFSNEAQLTKYTEKFLHSTRHPIYQDCHSSKVAIGSGQIVALGHEGYIGKVHQLGGEFISGEGGTLVYFESMDQQAILTKHGVNPTGIVHDSGRNWYEQPVWVNSKMGSSGTNALIGSGVLNAQGLDFWGTKGGFIYAPIKITTEAKGAKFEIPETRSLTKSGKTQFVAQPHTVGSAMTKNSISSDEGALQLVSVNGNIKLDNTTVSAAGDVNMVAQGKVSLNGIAVSQSDDYRYQNRGLLKTETVSSSTVQSKIYSSFLFTGGKLTVNADEFALSAVQGVVSSADINAHKTTFSGKNETLKNKTVTTKFDVKIPAVNNLLDILHGHNAKAIFKSIISSCGWDQNELTAILKADNVAQLPKHALNVGRNAWNVTALVAHACHEYGESPSKFVGAFTDKMGITFLEKGPDGAVNRILNPKFMVNFQKTTEETQSSHVIPTSLYVGGTFRLVGDKLQILDGSDVDAENLRIFLVEGIKATQGVDVDHHTQKTKKVNFGTNIFKLTDISVGVEKKSELQHRETSHLAHLTARKEAEIIVSSPEGKISGALKIAAESGKVSATTMSFVTTQDVAIEKQKCIGVTASVDRSVGAHANSHLATSLHTTETAGIDMQNGGAFANKIDLANGSQMHVDKLSRQDGQEGLPQVTGTAAFDSEKSKQKGISTHIIPRGETEGDIESKYSEKVTVHRPTVIANNVKASDLPSVNTSAEKATEVLRESEGGYALAAFKPDMAKMHQEAKEIRATAKNGLQWFFNAKAKPETKSGIQENAEDLPTTTRLGNIGSSVNEPILPQVGEEVKLELDPEVSDSLFDEVYQENLSSGERERGAYYWISPELEAELAVNDDASPQTPTTPLPTAQPASFWSQAGDLAMTALFGPKAEAFVPVVVAAAEVAGPHVARQIILSQTAKAAIKSAANTLLAEETAQGIITAATLQMMGPTANSGYGFPLPPVDDSKDRPPSAFPIDLLAPKKKDPLFDVGGKSLLLYYESRYKDIDFGKAFMENIAGKSISAPPPPDDENLFDRMIKCNNAKYMHIKGTNLWASVDRGARSGFAHGQVYWKIYTQQGKKLIHKHEADEFFNVINKHKGPINKEINMKKECNGVPGWKSF